MFPGDLLENLSHEKAASLWQILSPDVPWMRYPLAQPDTEQRAGGNSVSHKTARYKQQNNKYLTQIQPGKLALQLSLENW